MTKHMLRMTPMTSCLGAVVTDIDLDRDSAALRDALDRWRVVVVAGIGADMRSLERFADAWDSEAVVDHGSAIFDAAVGAGQWTIESSWQPTPPRVVIARCERAPGLGGDTMWSDLAAAYARLSPQLQAAAESLVAIHVSDEGAASHPVVRVGGDGRSRSLYVDERWTTHIDGLTRRERDALMRIFVHQENTNALTVRHRWRAGDVVIWDSTCTAHRSLPAGASPWVGDVIRLRPPHAEVGP
jgi:taurine dioxygenase